MTEINLIHESSLYGVVVETGAGAAITHRLGLVSGCSNTLFASIIPYSKDYEHLQYGDFARSVSKEFVETVAQKEVNGAYGKTNFVIASSAQVASDTNTISHVWMSIMHIYNSMRATVHFTFPKHTVVPNREALINEIGHIGTQLIACMIDLDSFETLDNRIADIITDATLDACYINGSISGAPVKRLEKAKNDFFLAYGPEGMMRFEELMRLGDTFAVNKGSFNPLHHQHVEMMNWAQDIPELSLRNHPVFLISTYRYDKPHVSWEELESRIEAITRLGYYVLICKEAFFYNTFKLLRQAAGKQKKFFFTIGSDTLNRIYKTDLEETVDADHPDPSPYMARVKIEGMKRIWSEQFKFIVFERQGQPLVDEAAWYDSFVIKAVDYKDDGTSSTKIRNGETENKI